jgi:hypothetical protein
MLWRSLSLPRECLLLPDLLHFEFKIKLVTLMLLLMLQVVSQAANGHHDSQHCCAAPGVPRPPSGCQANAGSSLPTLSLPSLDRELLSAAPIGESQGTQPGKCLRRLSKLPSRLLENADERSGTADDTVTLQWVVTTR